MIINRHGHGHNVCMIKSKSLMLGITLSVALGFPPACINSDTISM